MFEFVWNNAFKRNTWQLFLLHYIRNMPKVANVCVPSELWLYPVLLVIFLQPSIKTYSICYFEYYLVMSFSRLEYFIRKFKKIYIYNITMYFKYETRHILSYNMFEWWNSENYIFSAWNLKSKNFWKNERLCLILDHIALMQIFISKKSFLKHL